ncbi:MAG: protease inhibitor I42 family protein [Oscillospiraceae bacterium]|nr:protease inhibitor I42 family protein [Oscillospiraceae bacterium]
MKKASALATVSAFLLFLAGCSGTPRKVKDDTITTLVEDDGMETATITETVSVRVWDEGEVGMGVGDFFHMAEHEKQSIPYRWAYYLSDDSVVGFRFGEYVDDTPFNAGDGGDEGYRILCFEALAPGSCTVMLRCEDIRDAVPSIERLYTITVTDGEE